VTLDELYLTQDQWRLVWHGVLFVGIYIEIEILYFNMMHWTLCYYGYFYCNKSWVLYQSFITVLKTV